MLRVCDGVALHRRNWHKRHREDTQAFCSRKKKGTKGLSVLTMTLVPECVYRRSRGSSRRIRSRDHEDDTRSGVFDMTVTILQPEDDGKDIDSITRLLDNILHFQLLRNNCGNRLHFL